MFRSCYLAAVFGHHLLGTGNFSTECFGEGHFGTYIADYEVSLKRGSCNDGSTHHKKNFKV